VAVSQTLRHSESNARNRRPSGAKSTARAWRDSRGRGRTARRGGSAPRASAIRIRAARPLLALSVSPTIHGPGLLQALHHDPVQVAADHMDSRGARLDAAGPWRLVLLPPSCSAGSKVGPAAAPDRPPHRVQAGGNQFLCIERRPACGRCWDGPSAPAPGVRLRTARRPAGCPCPA